MNLSYENVDKLNSKASKNTVTLRFIGRGYYEGFTCLLSDGVTIDYEVNYVSTFNLTYKQIAYNVAHEIAHQLFHKAQLFFNGIITNFGDDGQGHFNKKPNLLMEGKYGGFHGSGSIYELLLPCQFNYIHKFLAK